MIRLGMLGSTADGLLATHGLYLADLMQCLSQSGAQIQYLGEPKGMIERVRYYSHLYKLEIQGHVDMHVKRPSDPLEVRYATTSTSLEGFVDACDAVIVLIGDLATYHALFRVLMSGVPVLILDPMGAYDALRGLLAVPSVTVVRSVTDVGPWLTLTGATNARRAKPTTPPPPW